MTDKTLNDPIGQLPAILTKGVAGFDQGRAAGLQRMSQLQSMRYAGLQRDRARLVAKFGAKSPRVEALDQQLAIHAAVLPGYQAEAAASTSTPPPVTSPAWALYGMVVDPNRKPVSGVTVALFTGDVWNRDLGYACTAEDGTFQILVNDVSKISDSFSLHILKNEKTVYVDPAPVTPATGQAEYREVVLDASQPAPCNPPDSSSRVK